MAKTQDGRNGSAEDCAATVKDICGDIDFPKHWTVFAPLERSAPLLSSETLAAIPETVTVAGKTLKAQRVVPVRNQFDFRTLFGFRRDPEAFNPEYFEKTAYAFVPLKTKAATEVTLGLGGDYWMQAWVNGDPILGDKEVEDMHAPVSIDDYKVTVSLKAGLNVLAVRLVAGKGSAILALGGPRELRTRDFRSILTDPLLTHPQWSRNGLRAKPGTKPVADIGSRRELFIDDFLIDRMTGSAERRLHHPVPRDVALECGEKGKPWESNCCGYYDIVQDGDRILMYYTAAPAETAENQRTCVVESTDGIHFTRPELGICEFNGSRRNNIVWQGRSGHNFTPFLDGNPNVPEGHRFKAIAYHPDGDDGLGAFVSPDGIHWRLLVDKRIITVKEGYGFDSQNLVFWDPLRNLYVCFSRNNNGNFRHIATCTSKDFINWTESSLLKYTDDRREEMYINTIRPYFRAPHIYIGTPARFVPCRTKILEHPESGVSDAILMSSRDGLLFERWAEGFVRPGLESEVWTERNNYPAWGMVQTSPEEISLYWTEHTRQPGNRLRRGIIRTDGFVSVHAGGQDVGEMLTRPLIFAGGQLEVNYATSAVGTMLFEVCDEQGKAIKGFSLADSEVLFGNELEHAVRWHGTGNLAALAGKPVRLRVRLHDADLYSFRFA